MKGIKFQSLRDSGDPAERAGLYEEQGADEIVILDVSATVENRDTQDETIRRVREVLSIPLTVGGGIRTEEDAARLLEAGADKISMNTAALSRPALLTDVARRFGSQCSVLAIDAAWRDNQFEVLIKGGREGTGINAIEWAKRAVDHGAGEILLTSWDRDGTHEGYDLALTETLSKAVSVPVIASGGAHSAAHMKAAFDIGADAVLAASIFHDDQLTVGDVKEQLVEMGVSIRWPS